MRVRVPDYFDRFHCLAGACPHSCCVGWEVVVDEETARQYAVVPGPLGERLRSELKVDEEGDFCFRSMADGARFWTKKICVRFTAAWGKRLPASPARNIPGLQKSMARSGRSAFRPPVRQPMRCFWSPGNL